MIDMWHCDTCGVALRDPQSYRVVGAMFVCIECPKRAPAPSKALLWVISIGILVGCYLLSHELFWQGVVLLGFATFMTQKL